MEITWIEDRLKMLDFLSLAGKQCAEIGVFRGEYSTEILKRKPERLYLVDPWREQPPSVYPEYWSHTQRYDFDELYDGVVGLLGHDPRVRIVRKTSFDASNELENECLDFAYVDGIHTFESCYMDIICWFPKVRQGGWLCGHDFTGEFDGVRKAVSSFCKITGNHVSMLTRDQWASWGIQRATP